MPAAKNPPSKTPSSKSTGTVNVPDTVIDQILAQAPDLQTAEAMLLGSSYEGGWTNPSIAVMDTNGAVSYGPFMMNADGALASMIQSLGLTQQQGIAAATDPKTAVAYMLKTGYGPAVQGTTVSRYYPSPAAGSTGELPAEQAAAASENPGQSYLQNYGQATLDQHWAQVLQAVQQNSQYLGAESGQTISTADLTSSTSGGGGGTGTSGSGGSQASNTVGQIAQQVDAFLNPTSALLSGGIGGIIGDVTGLNSAWQAIIQLVDRGITIVGGIGLIILGGYIASRPGKDTGTGALRQGVRSYVRGTATGMAQSTAYENRLRLRNQYRYRPQPKQPAPLRWPSRAGEPPSYTSPGGGGENDPFGPGNGPGGGGGTDPGATTPAGTVLGLPRAAGRPARQGGVPARRRSNVRVSIRQMATALPAGEVGEARVIETTARRNLPARRS